MRALLVCNPKATTTSDRVRDVLVRALRSETELDVAYTRRRGHGASLAREARKNGVDVVVALGGDGTVNEVVNGLLADGTGPDVPALAVVCGGSTNVFARALGLPTDWAEGTAVILEALRAGRTRSVGLGKVASLGAGTGLGLTERYFTFCAGFGMDAEVIHRVERARLRGRKSTPLLYMQAMAGNYVFEKSSRTPRITIESPEIDLGVTAGAIDDAADSATDDATDSATDGAAEAGQNAAKDAGRNAADKPDKAAAEDGERGNTDSDFEGGQTNAVDKLTMVVIQNTAPWTYIGDRAIDASPEASFDLGLDVMGIRDPSMIGTTRTMVQLLAGRRSKETGLAIGPHGKHVIRLHDLSEFTLSAKLPAGLQVDGDYLGEQDEVRFSAVPDAIRVVC
jgi:diacylglycerol kinase family enzyme